MPAPAFFERTTSGFAPLFLASFSALHVATMLRGAAGCQREPLKINGNMSQKIGAICDMDKGGYETRTD
jgi:hypothetical protein